MSEAYEIETRVEAGCMLGAVANHVAAVSLRHVAERLANAGLIPALTPGELEQLDQMDDATETEVGWRFGRRLRRKFKKAFKKIAKVAKKVVKNKLVKKLWNAAKIIVPSPYNMALTAAEGAVKLTKGLVKGSKKAKAILPAVRDAAAGKIKLPQLDKIARAAAVKPKVARQAAAIGRMSLLAKRGDAKAKAALSIANKIAKAHTSRTAASKAQNVVTELIARKKNPAARTYIVKGRSGRRYRALMAPV
jgi:hypothetical protein